ncbi:hypothetical protein, partial [uncultured Muriicola sp.]|uniref:hypothetical protein n=1 Tax=uncultured Muriicola sp. TaxID=1583102 RepID=UPI00260527B1
LDKETQACFIFKLALDPCLLKKRYSIRDLLFRLLNYSGLRVGKRMIHKMGYLFVYQELPF